MHMIIRCRRAIQNSVKVIEGQDVMDEIAEVATNSNDKPLEPVVMEKVYIE